jgi:hypothetical protein
MRITVMIYNIECLMLSLSKHEAAPMARARE